MDEQTCTDAGGQWLSDGQGGGFCDFSAAGGKGYQPQNDQNLPQPTDQSAGSGPVSRVSAGTNPGAVPGNVAQWIENAAGSNGLSPTDVGTIAAVIYYGNARGGWSGVDQSFVDQTVAALVQHQQDLANDPSQGGAVPSLADTAADLFGPPSADLQQQYLANITNYANAGYTVGPNRAEPVGLYHQAQLGNIGGGTIYPAGAGGVGRSTSTIDQVYSEFARLTGRDPTDAEAQKYVGLTATQLRRAISALPEAAEWRQYGPQVQSLRLEADRLWREYVGNTPTTAEILAAVRSGIDTAPQLEQWLRAQPYGSSTLGEIADISRTATSEARKLLSRDPTPQELNWLATALTNPDGSVRAPTADDISAFYEQLQQRIQTGDPAFAWAADPVTWKDTQSELQKAWTAEGMRGPVDPHMVNQAVTGKWDLAQMKDQIDRLPAPGFPGTTVGEVNRVRSYVQKYQQQYLPGDPVSESDMLHFIGMSPDEVLGYYRQLPWDQHVASALKGRASAGEMVPSQQTPAPGPGQAAILSNAPPAPAGPGANAAPKAWKPPAEQQTSKDFVSAFEKAHPGQTVVGA